jgi:outer membrane protein assembly factor BamA
LKKNLSKIVLIFLIGTIFNACSIIKKVPEDKSLLTKNTILVNDTINKSERIESLLYQKPNSRIAGFPLRLSLYNLAKEKPDSLYYDWLNRKPNRRKNLAKILSNKQVDRLSESFIISGMSNFLKQTGEAPVLIDPKKVENSKRRLKTYYENNGYFNIAIESKTDSIGKRKGKVTYNINTGIQFKLDTISSEIKTPALDSLYNLIKNESLIKSGEPYNLNNLNLERERITKYFRNSGAYKFQVNNIRYTVYDIKNPNHKLNTVVKIENQSIKKGDTTITVPFKLYKINSVNIFTKNLSEKEVNRINDSVSYKNFTIYSDGKLNYKPKALTNTIFINKGDYFSDLNKNLTTRSINNLQTFKSQTIEYIEDPEDENGLIANIYLLPRKKYTWAPFVDFTHSNIQDFGITGGMSFTWRNIFKRAEIFQISAKGNIGSSRDLANPNNTFFNISEYGGDAKLTFPRIFFPINTTRIIRKEMLPTTQMSFGLTNQKNIGLDKENFTAIINYNWKPKDDTSMRFDLFNTQFIRNLNADNYFNVYRSSYNRLNDLSHIYFTNPGPGDFDEQGNLTFDGADNFIEDVVTGQTVLSPNDTDYKSIRSIAERKVRLTENNLIVSSNFTFSKNTQNGILDNTFYAFRAKIESAGNVSSIIARQVKEPLSDNGNRTLFGIEYAQYVKSEFDYTKHWGFRKKQSFAVRTFAGIAIPYGNANSIPFSRSYFAGGSNDNRGWQAYSLGPGSSGGINDFNEANFKLAFSAEYRFNFFGDLYGALFADAGNIWNVFDNVEDEKYTFNGFDSLKDIALGTGIGFRYDFSFFVFRIDLGYKTYNPGKEMSERWFRDLNLSRTVLNFGINYPF